ALADAQPVGPPAGDPPGKPRQPAPLLVAPGRQPGRPLPRVIHVPPSPATPTGPARVPYPSPVSRVKACCDRGEELGRPGGRQTGRRGTQAPRRVSEPGREAVEC